MKKLFILAMGLYGSIMLSHAQTLLPNGGFEMWVTESHVLGFPPFSSISNKVALFDGYASNVTAVSSPTDQAVRLEAIDLDSSVQAAILAVGDAANGVPGIGFSEKPDSLALWLRYDILPGDNALFACSFFEAGVKIGGPYAFFFTGSQTQWTRKSFDIPSFGGTPDSIAVLIVAGDFGNAQAGSWLEIDSMQFIGTTQQLPNSSFNTIDSLINEEPDGWLSNNLTTQLLGNPNLSVQRSSTANTGDFAARISTIAVQNEGEIDTTGFLFLAEEIGEGGPQGMFPLPEGLDTSFFFKGFYQYHPQGNDIAFAYLLLSAYDSINQRTDTLFENIVVLPAASTYEEFMLEVNIPRPADSFMVAFSSSDIEGSSPLHTVGIGSYLLIDDLIFDNPSLGTNLTKPLEITPLRVYPNPADQWLYVDLPHTGSSIQTVHIRGLDGKEVHQVTLPPTQSKRMELNISSLTRGLYLVSFEDKQGSVLARGKFIKQ